MTTPRLFETGFESGAKFSACRSYRYALWRTWADSGPRVMFIGLNPSTADEFEDDPTIRRCIRFAKDWGYGGLLMLNAYAFRATNPNDMKKAIDPIGPLNDDELAFRSQQCGLVIAAWGVHCSLSRSVSVCKVINGPIYCLGKTKDRKPKHPLYLKSDTKPELFWDDYFGRIGGLNDYETN
jgi:hypothetical protein